MRWLALLPMVLVAWPALAQPADEIPLADILEVLVLEREVVAIDARHGGQREESLRLAEQVVWHGAQGSVGVVLTDQRVLAVAARSGSWQTAELQRGEVAPERAVLGDRVALVVTSQRALGYDGGSGNLVESSLGIREALLATRAGENVAVVVTDRRALGLSPLKGGFFETPILLGERIESVTANANLATVTTHRRILVFRATTGTWEERRRDLR